MLVTHLECWLCGKVIDLRRLTPIEVEFVTACPCCGAPPNAPLQRPIAEILMGPGDADARREAQDGKLE